MAVEKTTAVVSAMGEIKRGHPNSLATVPDKATPATIPSSPPSMLRITASIMNWLRMSLSVAPVAMRIPISCVRSVTETSMMFMIPMPPTRSEMDATPARSSVITAPAAAAASAASVMARTLKSASSSGRR